MNKRIVLLVVLVLLSTTGIVLYTIFGRQSGPAQPLVEEVAQESFEPLDQGVMVEVAKSRNRDNTVVLSVKGLRSTYDALSYELTYESQGLVKGVNSGSKPLDIGGKDTFEREVYLGTCSRNVCKPDMGVKKVSVVLEFTASTGKRSQFTQDYPL